MFHEQTLEILTKLIGAVEMRFHTLSVLGVTRVWEFLSKISD